MLNHRNETHRLWVYKVPLYLPFSGGHWDSPGFFQSHPSDYPNQTAHGTHLTNVTSRPGLKDAQSTHLRISLFLDHDDFEANDEKTTGFFLGGRRRFSTVVIDDWWMIDGWWFGQTPVEKVMFWYSKKQHIVAEKWTSVMGDEGCIESWKVNSMMKMHQNIGCLFCLMISDMKILIIFASMINTL